MRQISKSIFCFSLIAIAALVSLIAPVNAQDAAAKDQEDPFKQVENSQALADGDKTQAELDDEKSFQQIVNEVRENEKKINELFSSIPIGFPKLQEEQLAQIEALKETNEVLKGKLEKAALRSFKSDPKGNRHASQLVFNSLIKKLEITGPNQTFDPHGALEIAESMLKTNLDSEPPGPIRLEDVAYQAFLASYAIEDFARADLMLKKIEDKGIQLSETLRKELSTAQEKWQRELMIRRMETSTNDLPQVKLETTDGDIVVELFENHAPQTVANFISLVEKNFYNDLAFFLVRPSRIAQAGCPVGDGTGDAGYLIPCELDREQIRHHFTGTLSMANTGRDTGSSQFFITHQRNGNLDGQYTAFGRVIEGMDVVYHLKPFDGTVEASAGDDSTPSKILKATVIRKRSHEYAPTKIAKNPEDNRASQSGG